MKKRPSEVLDGKIDGFTLESQLSGNSQKLRAGIMGIYMQERNLAYPAVSVSRRLRRICRLDRHGMCVRLRITRARGISGRRDNLNI